MPVSANEPISWSEVSGSDLDARTLYDVLALRSAVFVVEQECAYQDPDGLDLLEGTRHLIGREGDGIAAYARLLAPDETSPGAAHRPGDRGSGSAGEAAGPRADEAVAGAL